MDEIINNQEILNFMQSLKSLADIEEENLTDEVMEYVNSTINSQLKGPAMSKAINDIISNLDAQGLTRQEALESCKALKDVMNEIVFQEGNYEGKKKELINNVLDATYEIFDKAIEKYHKYSIELPMTVEEGATTPAYAHDTDAAADLYAMENQIIAPHSYGNKIRTGVKIQLPEGWLAMILPRSSIGAKTPLRLSNSVGLIDSGYRGELGILYDNTSNDPYSINAGDRIAQLLIMPSYRFQAKVVDTLEDSDRGEGGFGSTGA